MTGLAVPQSARLRCNTRSPVRGQRPDRLRPCLQAWPRRHRLEAQGLRLPFRSLARLAQNEELGCTGREAGRGGGLGQITRTHSLKRERWGEKRPPKGEGGQDSEV